MESNSEWNNQKKKKKKKKKMEWNERWKKDDKWIHSNFGEVDWNVVDKVIKVKI